MENQLNNPGAAEDAGVGGVVRQTLERIARTCRECGRDPKEVQLMAVTKTVPAHRVNQAVAAGVTLLGENRAQELLEKYDAYQKEGVTIHFIGRLQTNKVRQVIDKVTMIQSLDRLALAQELQKECEKRGRTMDCLVEVNIGAEDSKSGLLPKELPQFLEEISRFPRLKVRGLMSIPPICETEQEKAGYFAALNKLFVDIRGKKIDNVNMDFLSMGMSDDYLLAIRHGANIVRLGTALFGHRDAPGTTI